MATEDSGNRRLLPHLAISLQNRLDLDNEQVGIMEVESILRF
jgi:hypothetical protein